VLTKNIANTVQTDSARSRRCHELEVLWKSKTGQSQVLALLWNGRDSQSPLQAGESVIDLILNHEFGSLPDEDPPMVE